MNLILKFRNGTTTKFTAWLIEANDNKLIVHAGRDVFYFGMDDFVAFGVKNNEQNSYRRV